MNPAPLMPSVLPVLLVLAGACACLVAEPFLRRAGRHAWLPWVGAFSLAAAAAALFAAPSGHLHGLFVLDPVRRLLGLAVLASTVVGLGGLQLSLVRDRFPAGDPYALALFAAAGALLMIQSADTLALFLALEATALPVYCLVGLRRGRAGSGEALLKYLAMGAVFSGLYLYGLALHYGACGATGFGASALPGRQHLWLLGEALMLAGLLFKVGAVPFHQWAPDAYTGAPAAVTGLMGAIVKMGGFAALGALWLGAAAAGSSATGPLPLDASVPLSAESLRRLAPLNLGLLLAALMSLLVGTFSALRQQSFRRMIAFSSVAHAGYMLLALALPTIPGSATPSLSFGGLWFYLGAYGLATAGALAATARLAGNEDRDDGFAGLDGQGRASPLEGAALTVFLASFAGLPPTAGFLGKFLVLGDLVSRGHLAAALLALLMALIGAGFYFKWLACLWAGSRRETLLPGSHLARWSVALAALALLALLAWPTGRLGS